MPRKLKWRVTERRSVTHRGVYVATITQRGDYAYGYLAQFDGVSVSVCWADTLDDAVALSDQHAARQPAHPPMLGWPACEALS